jgi:RHS repeat-associated protein
MKAENALTLSTSPQTLPARKPRLTARALCRRTRRRLTGKEQDAETGLYYYGARYLDPKAGRWLSGDPALGEYVPSAPVNEEARKRNGSLPGMGGVFNYANLHVYHYAGNNPVKYTDPDGMWGRDIHYGGEREGTLRWAQDDNRFTEAQARVIAAANNEVDSGRTGPMPWQDQSRHFNTNGDAKSKSEGDSRIKHSIRHLENAINLKNGAKALRERGGFINSILAYFNEQAALNELGTGLHSLQDAYAHADDYVSDFIGIKYHASPFNPLTLFQTNRADNSHTDPDRIRDTELATKNYLDIYLEATK